MSYFGEKFDCLSLNVDELVSTANHVLVIVRTGLRNGTIIASRNELVFLWDSHIRLTRMIIAFSRPYETIMVARINKRKNGYIGTDR